ncbi:MAG: hypothetical protein HUU46_12385 [Candidatus Hydrogenedentes bacterium]|nr:hypothetical protein [Candidatus Hydrogenedentota bacterium]
MSSLKWAGIVSCVIALLLLSGCGAQPPAQPAVAGAAGAGGGGEMASAPAASVSFAADVKPILDKHCKDCHLGGGSKGGFNLDTRENALMPGRHGARIIEGNGAGSSLVLRVAQDPSVKKMPPKGDALSAAEVETLKAWIDQGVKWE